MGFTCSNEIVIRGGSADERGRAAKAILAFVSVDEGTVSQRETAQIDTGEALLILRCESPDGLPEGELTELATQFPDLSFDLAYFSLDGEFYGYARSGAEGDRAESEDFTDDTRDLVARRHDGDRIAFVRDRFSLGRSPI